MVVFPNAKINLGLSVTEKRADGFHNIETVFYPVPLRDALEIIPAKDGKTKFTFSGFEIPGSLETNLCFKAWQMLKNDFRLPAINFHLHKAIPMGAGLGGGSADGAFTIRLLDQVFNLKLTNGQMQDYARQLGSDCAFFIENKPVFAFGKGDHFENINLDLSGFYLILIKPAVNVNTAGAYANITPSWPAIPGKEIISLSVEKWKDLLQNDFEATVFKSYPEIETIKNQFYENGALFASMSGSGSAVFGIFKTNIELKSLFPNFFYWAGNL